MSPIEKISIALPSEMANLIRGAVSAGEYASSSEIVREALRDWNHKRALREQGISTLRDLWSESANRTRDLQPDAVFTRLEKKYTRMAAKAKR